MPGHLHPTSRAQSFPPSADGPVRLMPDRPIPVCSRTIRANAERSGPNAAI